MSNSGFRPAQQRQRDAKGRFVKAAPKPKAKAPVKRVPPPAPTVKVERRRSFLRRLLDRLT